MYGSYNIPIHTFDLNAPFNAATFPKFIGMVGIGISALFIVLPEASKPNVNYKALDFKNTVILLILMLVYAFFIQTVGFFLSTSFFLLFAFYALGERRKKSFVFFLVPICSYFYVNFN